jgi:hypothetical protein
MDKMSKVYAWLEDEPDIKNEYVRRLAQEYKDYYMDAASLQSQLKRRASDEDKQMDQMDQVEVSDAMEALPTELMSPWQKYNTAVRVATGKSEAQYEAERKREEEEQWNADLYERFYPI